MNLNVIRFISHIHINWLNQNCSEIEIYFKWLRHLTTTIILLLTPVRRMAPTSRSLIYIRLLQQWQWQCITNNRLQRLASEFAWAELPSSAVCTNREILGPSSFFKKESFRLVFLNRLSFNCIIAVFPHDLLSAQTLYPVALPFCPLCWQPGALWTWRANCHWQFWNLKLVMCPPFSISLCC